MRQTLNRMQRRGQDDRGFTMIELLVVVVIIGVLVAIAVPVYLNYRKGAANKSAASDVRGAITAIEQYYTENGNAYPNDHAITAQGENMDLGGGQVVTVSPGNQLQYVEYTTPAPESAAAGPSQVRLATAPASSGRYNRPATSAGTPAERASRSATPTSATV